MSDHCEFVKFNNKMDKLVEQLTRIADMMAMSEQDIHIANEQSRLSGPGHQDDILDIIKKKGGK